MKEYRIATGWKILMYLFCPLLIGLGFFLLYIAVEADNNELFVMLLLGGLGIFFIAFMTIALIDAVKFKLIVTEDRIIKYGWRKPQELLFSNISGFTTDENYIRFIPAEKNFSRLKVSKYVKGFDEIQAWAATRFPNADVERVKREQQEILSNTEFGSTDEERAKNLLKANRFTKVLNGVSIAGALLLFFYPRPYEILIALCLLIPVAAIFALSYFKGLISIADKTSAYPFSGCCAFLSRSCGDASGNPRF